MIGQLLAKVIGTQNEREIKRLRPLVAEINALEPTIRPLTDEQLRAKTPEFRQRFANGPLTSLKTVVGGSVDYVGAVLHRADDCFNITIVSEIVSITQISTYADRREQKFLRASEVVRGGLVFEAVAITRGAFCGG